jgi:3-oxoacyl-[acyl-carrier-protein] synthase-1
MFIESTGMVCSVGLSAAAACAAMRAGIAGFQELPYLDDQGEAIVGAVVPGVPLDMTRSERLGDLLSMAIIDCLGQVGSGPVEHIPLLVGLAEPERPGATGLEDDIIARSFERVGSSFRPHGIRTIVKGHTSGFEGLRVARELFRNRGISACLVCGVDSYVNARSLLWLDQHQRLKTSSNSDGVIPGEAAAAVLVRHDTPPCADILTRIGGLGFAHENAVVMSEDPMLGLGLANAMRGALAEAGLKMHDIGFRLSDVTGESYGFKEQTLALGRVMRTLRTHLPLWHCADSIGDTGAAAGICQLVRAAHAFQKRYAPEGRGMCFTSGVSGDRAVAVLFSECRSDR